MSQRIGYSGKNCGSKEELKTILIALRRVNDIPLAEMAQKIGVPNAKLSEFERSEKNSDHYNEMYIQVLDEYVSLGAKQRMSFRDALKIYLNQRCLNRYNITYKLKLFGKIFYEHCEVNMNVPSENILQEQPNIEKVSRYRVWSVYRYDTAFFLLSALKEMLELETSDVAPKIGLSASCLKSFEKGSKQYKMCSEARAIVTAYAEVLTQKLAEKSIYKDVFYVVSTLIENGYTLRTDKLKLRKLLLDEIFKEA